MRGSGADNGRHSTSAIDDLRRQCWKVWGALVFAGLLFGLMPGRLSGPASLPTSVSQLLVVGESERGLVLCFDRRVAVTTAWMEGAPMLRIVARGTAQQGGGRWLGQPLCWHVREEEKALLLSLVSTRLLQGCWQWSEDGEGWRLVVELQERDGREQKGEFSACLYRGPQTGGRRCGSLRCRRA